MTIAALPREVLAGAFADRAVSGPEGTVSALVAWWNEGHGRVEGMADHLAAYIAMPGNRWRNALWDDPTVYRLDHLAADRSSARADDVIVEFRALRTVDGQSRSSPVGAPGSYLIMAPEDAWGWAVQSMDEVEQAMAAR